MTVLAWTHQTADVPEHGLSVERTAALEELQALQRALDILACDALQVRYRIKSIGAGGLKLDGRFEARVTQACVVSLKPVADRITGTFEVEFWPAAAARSKHNKGSRSGDGDAEAGAAGNDTIDPFAEVEVEAIENGGIDAGRIIYEELASLLNPYPRADGTEFDWQDPKAGPSDAAGGNNPFAKLSVLRGKKATD